MAKISKQTMTITGGVGEVIFNAEVGPGTPTLTTNSAKVIVEYKGA